MYLPKYFKLNELVYPDLVKRYGDNNYKLLFLFDPNVLKAADDIRRFLGIPVWINNYAKGFTESGYRAENSTTGADLSQHKNGRALDPKFHSKKWNPEKLREHMDRIGCFEDDFFDRTDEEAAPFLRIKRIEWLKDMSWFHLDVFDSMHGRNCIEIVR